jgi:hypothetical protein
MAYTVAIDKTTFGNKKVHIMNIIADGAEANLTTGLAIIDGVSMCKKSMNSSNMHVEVNKNSTAAVANGTIGISGCTAGDDFCLVVYGH